jgi:hypothetical protein
VEPPFVGPSYQLDSRPASVQRTVNLVPVPQEPGNERTSWVFMDAPGLVLLTAFDPGIGVGWHAPLMGSDPTTAARSNSGTANWGSFPNLNGGSSGRVQASIVGYVSGTVVWSLDWQPIDEFQTTPTIEPGPVESTILLNMGNSNGPLQSRGIATITATLDGVLVDSGVEFVAEDPSDFYPPCAWEPVP